MEIFQVNKAIEEHKKVNKLRYKSNYELETVNTLKDKDNETWDTDNKNYKM